MKYFERNPKLFSQNRSRFVKEMKKNSIAIFGSNDEIIANGDRFYPFAQNTDLFWLTGIEQEETMVILYPDNPQKKYKEVLVIVRPNELKEKWDGHRLTKEEAQKISGMDTIIFVDELQGFLQLWIHHADTIYLDSNENDRKGNFIPTTEYLLIQKIQQQYPLHQYERAAKIMKSLRSVKTKEEIAMMQKAIDITKNTFVDLLQFIKPDVGEYEIEAEIYRSFLSQKANRPAYDSIIASGESACTLHYIENNKPCKSGELILMDFGAQYSYYCADLTRTVPVNGKFTKRQKEVYDACLAIHNFCKAFLKPGITIADYHEKVGKEATKQFIKIGLLTTADVKNEDPQNPAYRRYLYHGISHHLGIDVHDFGPMLTPLKEGMVLTVEPGIYIKEEKIGIRIENNIWLTKNGNIDLMKNIPITTADIENLMKKK